MMRRAGVRDKLNDVAPDFALIDVGNGSHPRICAIEDVTATNAKLRLTGSEGLPDEFDIVLFRLRREYRRARVVRHCETYVDIEFVPPCGDVIEVDC